MKVMPKWCNRKKVQEGGLIKTGELDPHLVVGMFVIGFVAGLGFSTSVPMEHQVMENNTTIIANNTTVVHAVEKDVVEGYFRCSCGNGDYHKKKYRVWLDYCPMCHRKDVLIYNPKGADAGEWTCKRCGADYCAQDGYNKDGGYSGTQLIREN